MLFGGVAFGVGACLLTTQLDGLAGTGADAGSLETSTSRDVTGPDVLDAAVDGGASPVEAGAIAFVASSNIGPVFMVTTLDIPTPGAAVVGDVVLTALYTDGSGTASTPPGWTKLMDLPSATNTRGAWYVHTVAIGEPPQTTFVLNQTTEASAVAVAYRGVSTSTPVHAADYAALPSGKAFTAPSITTTVPDTLLVGMFIGDFNGVWTAPPGMTLRGQTPVVAAYDERFAGVGASGPRTASNSVSSFSENALIALLPR
jgi:hypothetical protein